RRRISSATSRSGAAAIRSARGADSRVGSWAQVSARVPQVSQWECIVPHGSGHTVRSKFPESQTWSMVSGIGRRLLVAVRLGEVPDRYVAGHITPIRPRAAQVALELLVQRVQDLLRVVPGTPRSVEGEDDDVNPLHDV